MFNAKIMFRSKLTRTLLPMVMLSIGLGVFLFINRVDAVDAPPSFSVAPLVSGVDDVAGATGTLWRINVTTTQSLGYGDILRIALPTTTVGSPFLISNPTSTAVSGLTAVQGPYKSLIGAPPYTLGVSSTIITSNGQSAFYGLISGVVAGGTAFSLTLGYVTNPSIAADNMVWTLEKWSLPPLPFGVPSMDAEGPPAPIFVTTSVAIISAMVIYTIVGITCRACRSHYQCNFN